MDYSLPVSSVHGISQARTLEWMAIPYARGTSQPKDRTWVSHTAGRFFAIWATWEALWDTSPPYSQSVGFPNKVAIPCPNSLSINFLSCSWALNSYYLYKTTFEAPAFVKCEIVDSLEQRVPNTHYGANCGLWRELCDTKKHRTGR